MDLTRGTPGPLLSAMSGAYFYPVVLVDIDWPGARLRAHSNAGSISFGGNSFVGVGKFGSVDVPSEDFGGLSGKFSLAITCDLDDLAAYADTAIRGRSGTVYLGATATAGGTDLIGAVDIMTGVCDGTVLRAEVTGEGGEVTTLYTLRVTLTTGPSYRAMAAVSHSHSDQTRIYPSDTAGRHLVLAQTDAEKTLWPEP